MITKLSCNYFFKNFRQKREIGHRSIISQHFWIKRRFIKFLVRTISDGFQLLAGSDPPLIWRWGFVGVRDVPVRVTASSVFFLAAATLWGRRGEGGRHRGPEGHGGHLWVAGRGRLHGQWDVPGDGVAGVLPHDEASDRWAGGSCVCPFVWVSIRATKLIVFWSWSRFLWPQLNEPDRQRYLYSKCSSAACISNHVFSTSSLPTTRGREHG